MMPTRSEAIAILADPARVAVYSDMGRALLWRIARGMAPVGFIRGRARR